jgi:hypothetical protein
MPEWFTYVFQTEYQKQKKNLDALSKKIFKMQNLSIVINYLLELF